MEDTMHRRTSRALLAVVTAMIACAVLVPAALAGQSLPSNNPADFSGLQKDGTAAFYAKAITPAMLGKPQTITFGNPEVSGGGSITIGKRTNRGGMNGYQTITGNTSQTYGLTAPTGLKWVIAGLEVQPGSSTVNGTATNGQTFQCSFNKNTTLVAIIIPVIR
jgi:hypothetical protein